MSSTDTLASAGPRQARANVEPDSTTDATSIRVAVLANYAGVLRRLSAGDFTVTIPPVRDSALNQLGLEIGALAAVLEHRFDELSRLSQISVDMNAGLLLEEILERSYASFRGLIPYDRIGCALIDHASWALRARWARSEAKELMIGVGYEQPLQGSSLETIVATGQPRILNDLPAYLAAHPSSDSTRRIVEEGMRASLTCPLVAKGRPIGFLFFSSQRAGTYENVHVELFKKVAEQLSVVVEKSLLYEKLVELNRQLTAAQQQLEFQASHDSLTGLPNRRAIFEEFERVAARAFRNRTGYGVLLIDVDHFKLFNDRHGHLVGDAALREVGKVLASEVRAGEGVGRYGGEEFMAVLELRHVAALHAAAERLRRAVEGIRLDSPEGALAVTASIGGALWTPYAGGTTEQLLADADTALYAAKAAGRNRIAIDARGTTQEH